MQLEIQGNSWITRSSFDHWSYFCPVQTESNETWALLRDLIFIVLFVHQLFFPSEAASAALYFESTSALFSVRLLMKESFAMLETAVLHLTFSWCHFPLRTPVAVSLISKDFGGLRFLTQVSSRCIIFRRRCITRFGGQAILKINTEWLPVRRKQGVVSLKELPFVGKAPSAAHKAGRPEACFFPLCYNHWRLRLNSHGDSRPWESARLKSHGREKRL